jgi:hypothetical protein
MNDSQTLKTSEPKYQDLTFYGITALVSIIIIYLHSIGFSNYYLGWISFSVAAFSVAGNDAIQTIGTFIESKKNSKLFYKVLVFCGLLYLIHFYGWITDNQEIHFHRLDNFQTPDKFTLLQLLAPIVLVIITRLKAPISTTFLVLGLFGGQNIDKMLTKSFLGYGIAFLIAILVYGIHSYLKTSEYNDLIGNSSLDNKSWERLQWFSTSLLWGSWLLQDTANIAIYLPKKLNLAELLIALTIIAIALTVILYTNGGKIQEIVSEKSDINSAKAATILDFIYAIVLLIFQKISKVPMSTTWVFLGLLAGREIIIHVITKKDKPYLDTFRQVGRDVVLASLGITISIGFYLLSQVI